MDKALWRTKVVKWSTRVARDVGEANDQVEDRGMGTSYRQPHHEVIVFRTLIAKGAAIQSK